MAINIKDLKTTISEKITEYNKNPDVEFEYDNDDHQLQLINQLCRDIIDFEALKLDLINFKVISTNESKAKGCLKSLKIEKPLNDFDNDSLGWSKKFLLKGNKVAKIEPIFVWDYNKNEAEKILDQLDMEKHIAKKMGELKIGPTLDKYFICCSELTNRCYKVIISKYVEGVSLEKWIDDNKNNTNEIKKINNILQKKINIMHSNGIVHNNLYPRNVIVEMNMKLKKPKAKDVLLTDYIRSFDMKNKELWDKNEYIKRDKQIFNILKNKTFFDYGRMTRYVCIELKKDGLFKFT